MAIKTRLFLVFSLFLVLIISGCSACPTCPSTQCPEVNCPVCEECSGNCMAYDDVNNIINLTNELIKTVNTQLPEDQQLEYLIYLEEVE